MTRKVILWILALVLLAVALFIAKSFRDSKQTFRRQAPVDVVSVFTETVKNTDVAVSVGTSGNLMAKNRVELYSEVQGIFQTTGRPFKAGTYFRRGQALLRLNSDEHQANLRAQKSSLYNQLVLFISDLRLDYPESYPNWEGYIRSFSMDSTLQDLPEPVSEKEKLFVSGRNLYTAWYNVKNLEERLAKYTIRAPFGGVLTEALVDPGTLVRAGQKLGEYIDPSVFELAVTVPAGNRDLLEIGKKVQLTDLPGENIWEGTVLRVNPMVDPGSQSVPVFIQVRGKDLREGMFLKALLSGRDEQDAFEISRKLLFDENKVFVVEDTLLGVREIDIVNTKENTVVVRGLPDGTELLSTFIPNAYAGMKVRALKEE